MFSPHAMSSVKREEDIINGAVLSIEHAFGFMNSAIDKNALFVAEDAIVYPCGRHLATLDLVSKRMDFIKREEPSNNY